MSSKKSYLIVGVISLSMFGSVIGFNEFKNNKIAEAMANRPEASMPVISTVLDYSSYAPEINAIGFITPDKGVNVNNELTGKIENIYFESGDYVEKGQVLLTLDTSYELAQLKTLNVRLPSLKSKYNRYANLLKKGAVSQELYDASEADYLALLGDIDTIEAKINQKTVKAPFSGFTGIREIQLGEYLSSGATIVRLEDLNLMKVNISVSQKHFHEVSVEQAVTLNVSSKEDVTYNGFISAISPVINPSTGLFQVEISIPNKNKELRSGMYANVDIKLDKMENQLIVPQTAIQYALYGESLYTIEKDAEGKERAKQTFIKTGHRFDQYVVVTEGVEKGDRIITNGELRLSNDILVHEVKDDSLNNSTIINKL